MATLGTGDADDARRPRNIFRFSWYRQKVVTDAPTTPAREASRETRARGRSDRRARGGAPEGFRTILGDRRSPGAAVSCLAVFAGAGWFTLAPPMIMLFFVGGAAGLFGDVVAGWRGAVLDGVISGLTLAVGQAVTWDLYERTAPELATLADPDWYAIAWLLKAVDPVVGGEAVWLVPAVALAATVTTLLVLGRAERRRATREGTDGGTDTGTGTGTGTAPAGRAAAAENA